MRMLVSVRSVAEAKAAQEGGADLIDIKEPDRGSLGAADIDTIRAILNAVHPDRPVSAALGELAEALDISLDPRLRFVKYGLSNIRDLTALDQRRDCGVEIVLTIYADHHAARSLSPELMIDHAIAAGYTVVLYDTFCKDGRTLLDHLPVDQLAVQMQRLQTAGIAIALAGSLTMPTIEILTPLRPDWFAVRGAVCQAGVRTAAIDPQRVRALADYLHQVEPPRS